MENRFLSLLYPTRESKECHSVRDNLPKISDEVTYQLSLDELIDLKTSPLSDYFTSDPEVIAYRQSTIRELVSIPELLETLSGIHPILDDIMELRRLDDETETPADSYLYSITEIELYVSALDTMYKGLSEVENRLESSAFRALFAAVRELIESEYYVELNKKLKELSAHVSEIKSITVGVNLDSEMRPESAGVISVNSERFKSGKILDKILRLSFKNDGFTAIAPLSPLGKHSDNKQEAMNSAFFNAISEVFRSSVRGWRDIVAEYVIENTDFLLKLLPEIEFLSRSAELVSRLADREGVDITYPELAPMEEKCFTARGLYNPRVALTIDGTIVLNDIDLDDNAKIYVLTGPNRGGKSVITVAMGAAQAIFQLGLPVPAASARLSPVSAIFTHFPEGAEDTIDKGRLGEECARLREIFDAADGDSMILLDESLSSTGAFEASYIAAEILSAFAAMRVRGIFSTHLHDLAAALPEINERSMAEGGVLLDTLVAGIDDGERSFKIYRAKPDGRSYAKDIADKYGLSFESLMSAKK